MAGFNPLGIVGGAIKGAGNFVGGAVNAAAGAIDGVVKAIVPQENNDSQQEEKKIPEPQFKDELPDERIYLKPKYVSVRQVTLDINGELVEGYHHYLRLSKYGVERVEKMSKHAIPLERIRVRNCSLFKKGHTEAENPLAKGALWGAVAAVFQAPNPLAAIFLGAISAKSKEDCWFLDILDYDEKEWVFALDSKRGGDDMLKYLDVYFLI